MNVVVLIGTLSRDPQEVSLPSGDRLVQFEVTTRSGERPADSAPVVWFDPPAAALALGAGDDVVVRGRVRRRFFRAGGFTQSRTEVVADKVIPARQAKRSRGVVEQTAAELTAAAGNGLGS